MKYEQLKYTPVKKDFPCSLQLFSSTSPTARTTERKGLRSLNDPVEAGAGRDGGAASAPSGHYVDGTPLLR